MSGQRRSILLKQIEEKVSLSDRFGLWLGFHSIDQDTYLAMINAYADALDLAIGDARESLIKEALTWSCKRITFWTCGLAIHYECSRSNNISIKFN